MDICTVKGGTLPSVIAPDCKFVAAVVIPAGTDAGFIAAQAQKIVSRYPGTTLVVAGVDLPDFSDPGGEMVGILQDTAESLGLKCPVPTPDIALSDCRYWRSRGDPGILVRSGRKPLRRGK